MLQRHQHTTAGDDFGLRHGAVRDAERGRRRALHGGATLGAQGLQPSWVEEVELSVGLSLGGRFAMPATLGEVPHSVSLYDVVPFACAPSRTVLRLSSGLCWEQAHEPLPRGSTPSTTPSGSGSGPRCPLSACCFSPAVK